MHKLPKNIKMDLSKGLLQVCDKTIYASKMGGGLQTVKMFDNADDRVIGMTNLNDAKLEKDQFFLCTGIILLGGLAKTDEKTRENFGAVDFDRLKAPMFNGEYTFKIGDRVLIKNSSLQDFNTEGQSNVKTGYLRLENPKFIEPQTEVHFDLDFPISIEEKYVFKVALVGAITERR